MNCENEPACPNPAQSPFVCCLPCLWRYSEEQYQIDKARREAEEKQEKEGEPCP